MSEKHKIIFITAALVLLFSLVFLGFFHKQAMAPTKNQDSQTTDLLKTPAPNFKGSEEAFKNALNLYIQKKQDGLDMSSGPCLGNIANDWVLDIAHQPREAVDEKPENQCAELRNGQAHHFIELNPDGKLIQSH